MTAALSAYLERLVHPARKAYATAYTEHLMTGSAAPKVPAALDADTAQKIRRKVECYATREDIPDACNISEGLIHLPEAVRAYAAEHGDTDLLAIVEGFVPSPTPEAAIERMSDHYQPQQETVIVETVEVDCLDITDLEPSLAKVLALKLVKWNGRGKVYSRRHGRRYLHRDIKRIDLADATVQALPNYSDLITTLHARGVTA